MPQICTASVPLPTTAKAARSRRTAVERIAVERRLRRLLLESAPRKLKPASGWDKNRTPAEVSAEGEVEEAVVAAVGYASHNKGRSASGGRD
jgi:hypothetical protein